MNVLKKVLLIGVAVIFVAGLTACNKPGPAETAGKKIDKVTENAGDKLDEAKTKIGEQSDKMGEALSDTVITTKVKGAILAEPGLSALQISVDTIDGVVTLSGSVDSQHDIDRAKEVASSVTGVKNVKNQLVLKSAK